MVRKININAESKIAQLYQEELQTNVLLVSYFNAINMLLNIDQFEPFIENLIKYSQVLLNINNLKILIRKKYEKYFKEYSLNEGTLVKKIIKKYNGFTIKNKDFEWTFQPKIEHVFVSYFEKSVNNMLYHIISKQKIKKSSKKINELYNKTKSHKDALELIINEIEEPIFLSNAKGRIILTNTAGLELLQYDYNNIYEFLEKKVVDSYMLNKDTPIIKIHDKYYKITFGFLGKNEELHMIILHDITDLKKFDEMKSVFISGISHEIKTPLTSLISGLKLLLMEKLGSLNPKQKQFLKLIVKDSNYLLELLENLIYTGKEIAGEKTPLVITEIDMNKIINDLLEVYAHDINEKGIKIKKNIPPIIIKSDYMKLRMILSNLISNAIKYNKPNGEIKINIKECKKHINIEIADRGIGIPANKVDTIFDKFTRVDELAHLKNGAGLGLYIVKKNTECLKGTVSVSSILNKGTKFTVKIPKEVKNEND